MIEVEPGVAHFVERGLRAEGWTVVRAASVEDGFELMAAGSIEPILWDLQTASPDGNLLTRMQDAAGHVHCLVRTDGQRGETTPDILAKPFDFDTLIGRIEGLVDAEGPGLGSSLMPYPD